MISTTPLVAAIDSRKPSVLRLLLQSRCTLSNKDKADAIQQALKLVLSNDVIDIQTGAEIFDCLSGTDMSSAQICSPTVLTWIRTRLTGLDREEISHVVRTLYSVCPGNSMLAILLLALPGGDQIGNADFTASDWKRWQLDTMLEILLAGFTPRAFLEHWVKKNKSSTDRLILVLPFLLKYMVLGNERVGNVCECFSFYPATRVKKKLKKARLILHVGYSPYPKPEEKSEDFRFRCCYRKNAFHPHGLQDLCRCAIRRSLTGSNLLLAVSRLPPLPAATRRFLLIDNIYPLNFDT